MMKQGESNNWAVWIAGVLATIVLAACSLYGKWINDSITDHEALIRNTAIQLERIETKLDLELGQHGLKYSPDHPVNVPANH